VTAPVLAWQDEGARTRAVLVSEADGTPLLVAVVQRLYVLDASDRSHVGAWAVEVWSVEDGDHSRRLARCVLDDSPRIFPVPTAVLLAAEAWLRGLKGIVWSVSEEQLAPQREPVAVADPTAELARLRAEVKRLDMLRDEALSGEHAAVMRAESAERHCERLTRERALDVERLDMLHKVVDREHLLPHAERLGLGAVDDVEEEA
jgi:hypothetical protein